MQTGAEVIFGERGVLQVPTIVYANPKGGAGKTTSALTLAIEIARKVPVTIIDADPNQPISNWGRLPGKPDNIIIRSGITEDTVTDVIDAAAAETPFTIVDLEGTASSVVAYAVGRADLVIIPLQAKHLDGVQAARAIELIQKQERVFRRAIPFAVMITRTSEAIKTRAYKQILDELRQRRVPILDVELNERVAFDAMLAYGGTLEQLDPRQVSGVANAQANARNYAATVVDYLRQARQAEEVRQ
jgi:chromosome partitioning protein